MVITEVVPSAIISVPSMPAISTGSANSGMKLSVSVAKNCR